MTDGAPSCSICLEAFSEALAARVPRLLPCGHTFCHDCLDKLAGGRGCVECPSRCANTAQVGGAGAAALPRNFALIDTLRSDDPPPGQEAGRGELARLEAAKRLAVDDEDYELAKQLKAQIDALVAAPLQSLAEAATYDLGGSLGRLLRILPNPAAALAIARRPSAVVVLDRSLSMGQTVQWAINMAVPTALERLGYQQEDLVAVLTFDDVAERVLVETRDPTVGELRHIDVKTRGRTTLMADAIRLLGQMLSSGGAFNVFVISDGFLKDMSVALQRAEAAASSVPSNARVAFALFRFFNGKPPDTQALAACASMGTIGDAPCVDVVVRREVLSEAMRDFVETAVVAFEPCMGKHMILEGPGLQRLPGAPITTRLHLACGQETTLITTGQLADLRLNGLPLADASPNMVSAGAAAALPPFCTFALAQLRVWLVGRVRQGDFTRAVQWFRSLAEQQGNGSAAAADNSLLGRVRSLRRRMEDEESPFARLLALADAAVFIAELNSKQQGDFLRGASVLRSDRLLARRALGSDIVYHDAARDALGSAAGCVTEETAEELGNHEVSHVSAYGGGEYKDILQACAILTPIRDSLSATEILQAIGGLGAPFSARLPVRSDNPWDLEVTGVDAEALLAESDVWALRVSGEAPRLSFDNALAGVVPLASCGAIAHQAYFSGALRPIALLQLASQLRGSPPQKPWGWEPLAPPYKLEDGIAAREAAVLCFAAGRFFGATRKPSAAEATLSAQLLKQLSVWYSVSGSGALPSPLVAGSVLSVGAPLLPHVVRLLLDSDQGCTGNSSRCGCSHVAVRAFYDLQVHSRLQQLGEALGVPAHAVAARRSHLLRLLAADPLRQSIPLDDKVVNAALQRQLEYADEDDLAMPDCNDTIVPDAELIERVRALDWLPSTDTVAGLARLRAASTSSPQQFDSVLPLTGGELFFGAEHASKEEANFLGALFAAAAAAGALASEEEMAVRSRSPKEARQELRRLLRIALAADYKARLREKVRNLLVDRCVGPQLTIAAADEVENLELHRTDLPAGWGKADANKPHISCVLGGHMDSGKSTLAGRLLFELGQVTRREVHKEMTEAERLGKRSFALAFLMDRMKEEREKGLSISVHKREFYTNLWRYSLIDIPGHKDFLKSALKGMHQADVGVLLVPADGSCEIALAKNNRVQPQGQSRQHARFMHTLGVSNLIVCVTKMDSQAVNFSQRRFEEVAFETRTMLVQVGWKREFVEESVPIIPVVGWAGDNLMHHSPRMPWWTGTTVTASGQTVVVTTLGTALNETVQLPERRSREPFRMPVTGVFKIRGVGDVLTGRIAQGSIAVGDSVGFAPVDQKKVSSGKVHSCEMHHCCHASPQAGDIVGLNVKGLDKSNMPRVGDVIVVPAQSPPRVRYFTALVQVLNPPRALAIGYSPLCYVHTGRTKVRLVRLEWRTGQDRIQVPDPPELRPHDVAQVVFQLDQPLMVEPFSKCQALGRILVVEGNTEVMIGKIISVE